MISNRNVEVAVAHGLQCCWLLFVWRCSTILAEPAIGVRWHVVPKSRRSSRMPKYPHPFDPNTIIRRALPEKSTVTLVVFNTLGERVATLIEGDQSAGVHEVVFNAARLSSGVYFYRMRAGNFIETKKLVVEK